MGVPGTLAATARLLREHGTFSLAQALEPAIAVASEGFEMSQFLHDQIEALPCTYPASTLRLLHAQIEALSAIPRVRRALMSDAGMQANIERLRLFPASADLFLSEAGLAWWCLNLNVAGLWCM